MKHGGPFRKFLSETILANIYFKKQTLISELASNQKLENKLIFSQCATIGLSKSATVS